MDRGRAGAVRVSRLAASPVFRGWVGEGPRVCLVVVGFVAVLRPSVAGRVVATLAVGWRCFRPLGGLGLWQHVRQGNEGQAR